MVRTAWKSVAALAVLLLPVVAYPKLRPMDAIFARADQIYASRDFHPTGWSKQGTLGPRRYTVTSLVVIGDGLQEISGLCDESCSNLDIDLLDYNGAVLASDHKSDDFPLITLSAPGRYRIRVTMVACAKPVCGYGLRAYVK